MAKPRARPDATPAEDGESGCWRGTSAMGAICPGAAIAIPTACGFRKSCCSRPALLRCWNTTACSLQRFPTVQKLAAARESSVLAAWSGLGYYRRARMLHAAAKQIVGQHKGRFPESVAELRSLPGIGRYTAAAIASIVFNLPVAVVDGNVERVLGRAFETGLRETSSTETEKDAWLLAEELLSRTRPGDFNQAMMELGATVCLPRQPRCSACPVFELCMTRGNLPQSRTVVPQKRRAICYALSRRNGSIFLVQRSQRSSLMPGMWELPEMPVPTQRAAPASHCGIPSR